MPKILITGAGGLIGTRIREMLDARGFAIRTLGRRIISPLRPGEKPYTWDIGGQKIDSQALDGVDTIIHLAGAGVANERWTRKRKAEIMDSRIRSTQLLYDHLSTHRHQVRTIISASAVGYYGDRGDRVLTEGEPAGEGFLADVTRQWEGTVAKMETIDIRYVCCRIGIVLAKNGGALPELTKTLPLGFAGYFDKDPLYYPWIHIDDVCGAMIYAITDEEMRGSYNTTAPEPAQCRDLMQTILSVRKSKALLTPVPPFALRLALGEKASMLLSSQRCSDQKLKNAGYRFLFPDLAGALKDIYDK